LTKIIIILDPETITAAVNLLFIITETVSRFIVVVIVL